MNNILHVGGADNYRALERDLQELPTETLNIIAAHIVAEKNRRTLEYIRASNLEKR